MKTYSVSYDLIYVTNARGLQNFGVLNQVCKVFAYNENEAVIRAQAESLALAPFNPGYLATFVYKGISQFNACTGIVISGRYNNANY